VNDDVDAGKRVAEGMLDPVGSGMALADRGARGDADHHIRESLGTCAPEP
jgi:hypothetical protein